MGFFLDAADSYAKTCLDFFRLGPPEFLRRLHLDASQYMPAYQFFGLSVFANVSVLVIGLRVSGFEPAPDQMSYGTVMAFGQCLAVFSVLLGAMFARVSLAAWPASGTPRLGKILEFWCYFYCLYVAVNLYDTVVVRILRKAYTNSPENNTLQSLLILLVMVELLFSAYAFIVLFRGVAYVSGLSVRRSCLGCLFWAVIFCTCVIVTLALTNHLVRATGSSDIFERFLTS